MRNFSVQKLSHFVFGKSFNEYHQFSVSFLSKFSCWRKKYSNLKVNSILLAASIRIYSFTVHEANYSKIPRRQVCILLKAKKISFFSSLCFNKSVCMNVYRIYLSNRKRGVCQLASFVFFNHFVSFLFSFSFSPYGTCLNGFLGDFFYPSFHACVIFFPFFL